MNVEVCGRIRPSLKAEGAENLIIEGQRLAAHPRGPYLNFKALHRQDASNLDLFRTSVDDLLDYYLAGFNVSLLVMGESGAGKSHTLMGEGTSKAGIVPMIFDALFTRLQAERYMADTRVKRQNPTVTMEMFEIYNELIKDLLQVPGSQTAYLEPGDDALKGTYVKNCSSMPVRDSTEATQQFRQGLSRRTEQTTDYGPAHRNAATLIHLDLKVVVGENPSPNKSRFTIVELPGLEKLSDDPNQLRQREGPALSKALIALNQVVTSLSSNPYPDRVINYSDSKLTLLLKNELGGNCKTRGILCLKPTSDQNTLASILNFTTRLTQVKNFPIVNDSYAQNLIAQYQARIIDLQQQSGVGPAPLAARMTNAGDVKETIRHLETENLRLKDENERLRNRMDNMQHKFGTLATTKTDLSQELLLSEEEKLKMSQAVVEMQIENNKMREEAEATKFELTNKILMLENELLEAQAERDRNVRLAKNARDRLAEMEKDRKDLADEYVVLKTNYLALVREHEKETERNEELSIELLNLVNNKAALMKQVAVLSNGDTRSGEADAEVDRVKAIVIQNSSGKVKIDEILGTQKDRESVEQTLFANKKRYESEMERMRKEQKEETGKKDKQLGDLQKDFQDARNLARDRQQKIAELNAAVIIAHNEKENLEMQRNRLQHKVKDLGEDYRMRLIKYIEDISDYVDKGSGVPDGKRDKRLKEYVDTMLKEISRSHKEREDQLSQAAQGYREAKRLYAHKYEELLIAFRRLRLTAEARGIEPVDLGPDEHQLNPGEGEVKSGHLREIGRLKAELADRKSELDRLKKKYGLSDDFRDMNVYRPGEKPPESWAALRKQLREFTLNTQQQLEDERTKLLSENNVLKEQLRESQDYIDSHLAKYKQEIVKLRKLLGYEEDGTLLLTDRSGKGKHRRH